MNLNLLFYGVASIFYLLVSVKIILNFKKSVDSAPIWALPMIALGVIAHFWILQSNIFIAPGTILIGFGTSVSAMCFFSTLILLFGAIYSRVHVLFGLILLVSSFGVWFPVLFPVGTGALTDVSSAFKIHIAMGLVSYSFMLIAIVQAILMTIVDTRLKNHTMLQQEEGLVATLPSLLMMEKILFRLISACFAFLTLTIATGVLSSANYLNNLLIIDHKSVLTVFAWVVFGVLLLGRKWLGWRSRTAMCFFWLAVVLQVIAYFVYRFFLDFVV